MKKICLAITGASGSIYAKLLLQELKKLEEEKIVKVFLVWSENAKIVWKEELGNEEYEEYNKFFSNFNSKDFFAPMASGSANIDSMIICPCSMGTLGRIASGISNDLITRAADVMLKERRKMICTIRETPLNEIQIENMLKVTKAGGVILPAMPSFYFHQNSIEELTMTVVNRILKMCDLPNKQKQWGI